MKTSTVLVIGIGGAIAYALWKRRAPAPAANPLDTATGLGDQAVGLVNGAVGALTGLLGGLTGAGGGAPVAGGIQPLPKPPEQGGWWSSVGTAATSVLTRATTKPCCDGCAQGQGCAGTATTAPVTSRAPVAVIAPSLVRSDAQPVTAPSRTVLMRGRAMA